MRSITITLLTLSVFVLGCADEADDSSKNAPYKDISGNWTFKSNDLRLTGEIEIAKSVTNTFVIQRGSWSIDGLNFTNSVKSELSLGSNLTIDQIPMQNNSDGSCMYLVINYVTYLSDFTSMTSRSTQSYEYYLPSSFICFVGLRDDLVTFERKK